MYLSFVRLKKRNQEKIINMEIIFFVKVVIGVIAIVVSIESYSRYLKSWKKAKNNIEYNNTTTSNTNIISNQEALYQAKQYFENFEEKAYRLSKYLKSDDDLPITFKPQRFKFLFISVIIIICGIPFVFESNKIEGEIFYFIPLGGTVILCLGVFMLGIGLWMLFYVLKFFDKKLVLDKEEMIILSGNQIISIGYSDCHLIVTPSSGRYQLNLIPNNLEIKSKLRVVGFIQQKLFVAILITKFIEKGNFQSTTEVDIHL